MKLGKSIIILLLGVFLFNSCMDEIESGKTTIDVVEGIPVEMTLPFQAGQAAVMTKADEDEFVQDLYVVIFDKDGNYESHVYCTAANSLLNTSNKTVKIRSTSGEKRLFAVANVTASNFNEMKSTFDTFLTTGARKTVDDWLMLTETMINNSTEWYVNNLLMSGRYHDSKAKAESKTDLSGKCIFGTDGKVRRSDNSALVPGESKIWLTRSVAQIVFNIKEGTGVEFTPTSYSIHNLPKSVYLYEDGVGETGKPYFTNVFTPVNNTKSITNNSFNFYMLENIQPDGPSNLTQKTREAFADGKYTHAPHGTYIILKGEYKGMEQNPFLDTNAPKSEATATVTYFIHLGNIAEYGGASDFSVYRNHKYTYNVTVNGVNDIIVEAWTDKGNVDNADGHVLFSDREEIVIDSHYGRLLLSFPPGKSIINSAKNVTCNVKTAKTGWKEVPVTDPKADIDWIYFVEKGIVDALEVNLKGPDFTITDPTARQAAGIYNIRELADLFEPGKLYGAEAPDEVQFYAYIAENYYEDLSLDKFINYEAHTGEQRSRLMRLAMRSENKTETSSVTSARFVIKQRPIVTIFDVTSVDGGWGLEWINENLPYNYYTQPKTEAGFDFKATTAGIDYGDRATGSEGDKTKAYDGRARMIQELGTIVSTPGGWFHSDIIGTASAHGDDLYYAKAYAACMSRNRDENGNGIIEDEEIKWYLPAIWQYQHFWVGTMAIPEDAILYPAEVRNWNVEQRDKSPLQLRQTFAFHSAGGHRFQADEGTAVRWNNVSGRKHIRCARYIGTGDDVKLATYSDNSDYVELSVGGILTESSLRETPAVQQLPLHNEYDNNNKLFKKFRVKKETFFLHPNGMNNDPESDSENMFGAIGKELSKGDVKPCDKYNVDGETGWRIPNQRELILITTIAQENGLNCEMNLISLTYSTLWNWVDWEQRAQKRETAGFTIPAASRYGYSWKGGISKQLELPFPGYDYGMQIRCVKDVP